MNYLFVLLLFIIGLILTDIDLIYITISLILFSIFIIIFKVKKRKKPLTIGIILLLIGAMHNNIYIPDTHISNSIGIVTKKSEGYAIVRFGPQKYFTYDLDESRLFDIVEVSGKLINLDFKKVESSFDFGKYLNQKGVRQQLLVKKAKTIVQNPINSFSYQNNIINKIRSYEGKMLVKSLIFGSQDGKLHEISSKLMITSLLSTTGFFLNFVLYGISKFLAYFMYEKQAKTFTFILFLPFMILNINRFTVIRCGFMFLLSLILSNYNFRFDLLKKKSLIYLIFLFINPSLIYTSGYYIPLFISIFLEFSWLFLKHDNSTITKIRRKILIMVILFPFIIKDNNAFNIISIFITFGLGFYFKFVFLLAFLSFYGLYLPFYDSIFKFTFNILDKIEIKYLNINCPHLGSLGFVIYFLALILFLYFKEINFKQIYKPIFITIVSAFVIYLVPIENEFTCKVSFINVGQGDSTLIRYKNKSYLIDTGGNLKMDLARECLIPYLRSQRIYKLDSVFITHYDFDHYGALDSLKRNFIIENIYDYNSIFPMQKGPINFINLNTFWSKDTEDENEKSLVLYLKICNKTFLLMGDAPSIIEHQIIEKQSITCDILKVGHHGSNTSSSLEFLKAVEPDVAIISCGKKNKYGHPNKETIQNLETLKIPYRRTDIESTITYQFNVR